MSTPREPDAHVAPHWGSAALVTIDVQRDFLSSSPYGVPGTTEVLPALRRLAEAFRAANRPIVHIVRLYERGGANADRSRRALLASAEIVTPGSPGSQLADGLGPQGAPPLDPSILLAGKAQELGPAEYAVFKPRWGAFYRTPLDEMLQNLGVDTVVFAGCNLPNCPRASLIEASERDYRVVLASDAVSQGSAQGFDEVARIGVQLHTTQEVVGRVAGGAAPRD